MNDAREETEQGGRDGNREENGEEQCVGVESQGGKRLLQRREGKKRGRRVNILGKYVCTHKRVQSSRSIRL